MGKRGEHSREEIIAMALDAAVALLEEAGPERLTTRAVASRIGYTAGSLYVVFRDRDDLVLQINARTLDELRACLDAELAAYSDPEQRLTALGRGYLAFAQRHPARWRMVFEHDPPREAVPAELQHQIDDFFQLLRAELCDRAPWLDEVASRRAAQCLWSGVHGIAMLTITHKLDAGGESSGQALSADLIDHYLLGLAARR